MSLRSVELLRALLDADPRSYREIAAAAAIGHSTLANLAVGRRVTCSSSVAQSIARTLGVNLDVLFTRSGVVERAARTVA